MAVCRIFSRAYATYYTADHMWITLNDVRHGQFGFTQKRIEQMREIVYASASSDMVELEGESTIFSVKAPLPGEIVQFNQKLFEDIDLVRDDPEGDGWLAQINPEKCSRKHLMTKKQYRDYVNRK